MFQKIASHLQGQKVKYVLGGVLLLWALASAGWYLGYQKFQATPENTDLRSTMDIVSQIEIQELSRNHCQALISDDLKKYDRETGALRKKIYDYRESCLDRYDIARIARDISFCKRVIGWKKSDFQNEFLRLEGFEEVQLSCRDTYLTVSFTWGILFSPENNFKSEIRINFWLPFYYDVGDPNSEEFIAHRTEAKKRLIELLDITPQVSLDVDDITLYSSEAILSLDLLPETEYLFALRSYDSEIQGEQMRYTPMMLITPDFSYFWLKRDEKITLLPDSLPAKFQLLSYNSDISDTSIKICRVPNETFAKIEVFESSKRSQKEKDDFFQNTLDTLKTFDCFTQTLSFSPEDTLSERVQKKDFDLSALLWSPARSGLYYVTFENPSDRKKFGRVQEALFFGVIDSHITMKIAKNGKAFFFVNDFAWKALEWQNIRVSVNDFREKDTQYNYNRKTQKSEKTVSYFSPLENQVLSTDIFLGTTNEKWILEVNMKEKIGDVFQKTLENWEYEENGNLNSFFVTSSSEANLSYASSQWNGGITPWNFWYSIGSGWWYGEETKKDDITLNPWDELPVYLWHSFTDRKLYLPGEEVHFKAFLRTPWKLEIPVGKELLLEIRDSLGEILLSEDQSISDLGTITKSFTLSKSAPLWNYFISLKVGKKQVLGTGFSVEIFQNPKFQNEVQLSTTKLDEEVLESVSSEEVVSDWWYTRTRYSGDFEIKALISSKYFSGNPVSWGKVNYKVYRQYFYDTSYWDDCFYGCYWEPEKEFYSEGTGVLDEAGKLSVTLPVKFESYYNDYRYIVEATVTDTSWDTISGANSLIVRLPTVYKNWDPQNRIQFELPLRFYEAWETVTLEGKLSHGTFSEIYENQDILIIKKKQYYTDYLQDVRGYLRPKTRTKEVLQDIFLVNSENFELTRDGTLKLNYKLPESWEYIFEYGKINPGILNLPNGKTGLRNVQNIVEKFQNIKSEYVYLHSETFSHFSNYDVRDFLTKSCDSWESTCSSSILDDILFCQENYISYKSEESQENKLCKNKTESLQFSLKISLHELIKSYDKNYFSIVAYGDENANNPIQSDNKITVLTEKYVYKIGEKARVLVRLPFSWGKILWTEEKDEVIQSEYIDVPGNIFFKEIEVTDAHLPNTYISVVAIPTDFSCPNNSDKLCVPEYKVGYTEIIGDKTEKKSEILVKTDKQTYMPREKVKLDIEVQDRSKSSHELTVMVVDDSLIALMGNIDPNILEKIYKKLPFQMQTAMTNIAMLANYYFSRKWVVWGSGMGNFKGWDSALSTRMIFKNTAYYNASIITDARWKAQLNFDLPDNLTNFRVMVVSQSKNNTFWYAESFIEVRKDVFLEPRVPKMLRNGDRVQIGANVFNTTKKELSFELSLESEWLSVWEKKKSIKVPAWESIFVSFDTEVTGICDQDIWERDCKKKYSFQLLWNTPKESDRYEGSYLLASDPLIYEWIVQSMRIGPDMSADISLKITENTDPKKSLYTLGISNTPLEWIEKSYKSLLRYPWWCVEQLLSSTLPNALLKRFTVLGEALDTDPKRLQENLDIWYDKIMSLQRDDGGFKYWENDSTSDREITPHILRQLIELKNAWYKVEEQKLQKTADYLTQVMSEDIPDHLKFEIVWSLSKYFPQEEERIFEMLPWLSIETLRKSILSHHDLLSFTYSLFYLDKEKYLDEIMKNIAILKTEKLQVENHLYYSLREDKGVLAQLMIDVWMTEYELSEPILNLYKEDWRSYWFSTKEKNAAMLAFVKYMETFGTQYISGVSLEFTGETKNISLDSKKGRYLFQEKLEELLDGKNIPLNIKNTDGSATLFAQSDILISPLDPLKVSPYSQGMKVERQIYEVTDESKLSEECRYENNTYTCIPAAWLKLHVWNEFQKGKSYKIVLRATFETEASRNNLTLEDHIPWGFSVIQSNFLTESAALRQVGSQNSWNWNQTQNRPEVVMANAKYSWGNKAEYSYFIRADYIWEFLYPPLAGYLMYEPTVRANTGFQKIVIR